MVAFSCRARFRRRGALVGVLLWGGLLPTVQSAPEPLADLEVQYRSEIRPLVERLCAGCHSTRRRRGELDLERFATFADVRLEPAVWQQVLDMLSAGEMPPTKAKQPSADETVRLQSWVRRYLDAEALEGAGDPGPVVLRRLNNAEYTYTIRDLTGVALDPAREFPTDGAAGEGFTNTGNALGMSPALLEKYLAAGKEIAAHAVLLPDGFRFSPHATRRDWTDEILGRIRGLYARFCDSESLGVGDAVGNVNVHGNTRLGLAGRLPLERYFAALLDVSGGHAGDLNPRYLATLRSRLLRAPSSLLLERLRERLTGTTAAPADALAAEVRAWQKGLWTFGPVGLLGRKGGPTRWMEPAEPLVTRQELRLPLEGDGEDGAFVLSLVVTDAGDGSEGDFVVLERPRLTADGRPEMLLRDVRGPASTGAWGLPPEWFGKHPGGGVIDEASLYLQAPVVLDFRLPKALFAGYEFVTAATMDTTAGAEGSVQPAVLAGRAGAAAGLRPSRVVVHHSQVTQVFSEERTVGFEWPVLVVEGSAAQRRFRGAFDEHRSLFPAALCYAQIVPVDEVLTLTLFYREDDHLGRLMLDVAQRAELDRLWEELDFVSHSPILHVDSLELLLETMSGSGQQDQSQYEAILPLREPYHARAEEFRQELVAAQTGHLNALVAFASRAYRRPLADEEVRDLRQLYAGFRAQPMDHERAFRLTLARVFVSPDFLYRIEERRIVNGESRPSPRPAHPVTQHELANRLSYFLWSSAPDADLREAADRGELATPEALRAHARRMLRDARVRRLAIEFACQWLQLRDFDTLDEKSEEHFPGFRELRDDLYEESIQFFTALFREDGSVLDILGAKHTYLNETLARHYGIPQVLGDDWRRVDTARRFSRGGILTQGAVLAKQSGASRSSPIVRGNFVFETLLGERMPRPPREVPELPDVVPAGLTERQLVEQHTSVEACAKCHRRIDPYGFALEGFDAVGRWRQGGAQGSFDVRTVLDDGTTIEGHDGLRDYLLTVRREDFVEQFCRKLLGYALGRAVQLSDEPLLDEMSRRLSRNDYRFFEAIDTIVTSEPFRNIRGRSGE